MSDFAGKPVKHMLVLSLTGSYPAVIRKHSLDLPVGLSHRPRDGSVVSSLHCMNDPQPEGSHGKPHRTTKILSHARRRGGCVAARGARARANAGDRIPPQRVARRASIYVAAFREGVRQTGNVDGRDVTIEF